MVGIISNLRAVTAAWRMDCPDSAQQRTVTNRVICTQFCRAANEFARHEINLWYDKKKQKKKPIGTQHRYMFHTRISRVSWIMNSRDFRIANGDFHWSFTQDEQSRIFSQRFFATFTSGRRYFQQLHKSNAARMYWLIAHRLRLH